MFSWSLRLISATSLEETGEEAEQRGSDGQPHRYDRTEGKEQDDHRRRDADDLSAAGRLHLGTSEERPSPFPLQLVGGRPLAPVQELSNRRHLDVQGGFRVLDIDYGNLAIFRDAPFGIVRGVDLSNAGQIPNLVGKRLDSLPNRRIRNSRICGNDDRRAVAGAQGEAFLQEVE